MALLGEAFVARAPVTQAYESHEGVIYIYMYRGVYAQTR